MSQRGVRRNRAMEQRGMKLTVAGAVLIVAAAIVAVLVVHAFIEKWNRGGPQNETRFAPSG